MSLLFKIQDDICVCQCDNYDVMVRFKDQIMEEGAGYKCYNFLIRLREKSDVMLDNFQSKNEDWYEYLVDYVELYQKN